MNTMRHTLIAAVVCATLGLAGCGDDSGTTADPTPSPTPTASGDATESQSAKPSPKKTESSAAATVAMKIRSDSVTPVAEQVEIGVGEVLEVKVDSDRDGELHVHSTPEQFFEFQPGKRTLEITIEKPGQVDIEEHDSGALVVRALVQ